MLLSPSAIVQRLPRQALLPKCCRFRWRASRRSSHPLATPLPSLAAKQQSLTTGRSFSPIARCVRATRCFLCDFFASPQEEKLHRRHRPYRAFDAICSLSSPSLAMAPAGNTDRECQALYPRNLRSIHHPGNEVGTMQTVCLASFLRLSLGLTERSIHPQLRCDASSQALAISPPTSLPVCCRWLGSKLPKHCVSLHNEWLREQPLDRHAPSLPLVEYRSQWSAVHPTSFSTGSCWQHLTRAIADRLSCPVA